MTCRIKIIALLVTAIAVCGVGTGCKSNGGPWYKTSSYHAYNPFKAPKLDDDSPSGIAGGDIRKPSLDGQANIEIPNGGYAHDSGLSGQDRLSPNTTVVSPDGNGYNPSQIANNPGGMNSSYQTQALPYDYRQEAPAYANTQVPNATPAPYNNQYANNAGTPQVAMNQQGTPAYAQQQQANQIAPVNYMPTNGYAPNAPAAGGYAPQDGGFTQQNAIPPQQPVYQDNNQQLGQPVQGNVSTPIQPSYGYSNSDAYQQVPQYPAQPNGIAAPPATQYPNTGVPQAMPNDPYQYYPN
ncbi:MAG: hypothetical protein LBU65_17505 [Planctomycetaceae bacterium]|nr:hypothetical protein [Planctomycetaceae bacterium]